MTSKSKFSQKVQRAYKRFNRNKKSIRMVALSLAVLLVLSVFSANIVSIVDLLSVSAATHDTTTPYSASLTLYDYYTDNEIKNGGTDNNANDGLNKNHVFNDALYQSSYVANAGEWSGRNLDYFPLYLGLQHNNSGNDIGYMMNDSYKYSLTVNSQADSGTSAAAQGLVNDTLINGVLTQGTKNVPLPYFDEDFLTAPITNLVGSSAASYSKQTVGKVESGFTFNFVKNVTSGDEDYGYYEYDSSDMGINYSSSTKTFNAADSGTTYNDLNGSKGFFPWRYINNTQNFGYGAKFEIPFTMSNTGTIIDMSQTGSNMITTSPIKFKFSGDDDVWVFIDDKLVLDIGGAHGRVEGEIDFSRISTSGASKSATSHVNYIKSSDYYNHSNDASYTTGSSKDITSLLDGLNLYDDATQVHKLTVYYIERGSMESNCKISFNFQIADSVSVENTVDTSRVGSWFLEDTLAMTEKEGIEYLIASNGAQSGLESPDAGDDISTTEPLQPVTKYLVNFTTKYDYYQVPAGTTISLPSGYNVTPKDGYYMNGWIISGDTSGTVYTTYTVNSNVLFAPNWVKIPIELDSVPQPLLLYINGKRLDTANVGGGMPKYTDGSTIHLINYTQKDGSVDDWFKDESDKYNNDSQYPNSGQFTNVTNGAELGDRVIKMKPNYVYVIYKSGALVTRYAADSTDFHSSMTTAMDTWLKNYNTLYEELLTANANIKAHDSAGQDVTSEVTAYNTALSAYKTAVPLSTDLTTLISNLQAGVPDVVYNYSYAYGTDTTTFYVYSASGTPTVTIENGSYSGLSTPSISISKFSSLPSGAVDTTKYPASNYYKVTVPKYIVETKTPQTGGTTTTSNIPTQIKVNSVAASVKTSTDVEGMTGNYPCYYTNDAAWRDITDDVVSYAYSSTQKVFWVYSTSGKPTVTYSSPISDSGLSETTATCVENAVVANYYGYKVPTSVVNSSDGTSQTVNLNINGTTVALTTTSGPVCYFSGLNNLDNGWHKLVTICSPYSSITSFYAWKNSQAYPDTSYSWSNQIKMTQIDSNNYFGYLPYNSGVGIKLGVDSAPDYTLNSSDAIYTNDNASYNPVVDSSNTTFYESTATFKASSESGSYLSTSTYSLRKAMAAPVKEETTEEETTDVVSNSDVDKTEEEVLAEKAESTQTDPASQGALNGQFVNSNGTGTYDIANGVNFKLYAKAPVARVADEEQSVVRQTNKTDGGFYLLFGQTGKFTYQFSRKTGLKIAQTGSSWKYNDTHAATTVNPSGTGNGYMISNDNSPENALYSRYRTKWTLTDDVNGKVVSSRENYSVYLKTASEISSAVDYSGTFYNNSSAMGSGAIILDNIYTPADGNTGVHLKATFTNEVITGSLNISKELTAAAKNSVEKYRTNTDSTYNPEFKFKVEFSNIFGNGDTTSKPYANGAYTITGTSYTADSDGIVTINYDQIAAGESIYISGIPADTKYTVTEIIENETGKPAFKLNTVLTETPDTTDTETTITAPANNAVSGQISAYVADNAAVEANAGKAVGVTVGPLAEYYTTSAVGPAYSVTYTNDVNGAYIKITKQIYSLYYGSTDNPAGLLDMDPKPLIGGISSSITKDPNGYERATEAEQTFVFKITEYSDQYQTVTKTFYETISFGLDDTSYIKDKYVAVDPSKYYEIEEVTNWSWKYKFAKKTVTPDTNDATQSGSKIRISEFADTMAGETQYLPIAWAMYTNTRNSDKVELEGDTAKIINIIRAS